MANIIKGNDLMLFNESGKSLAFATNHTLSISADAVDTSSKDHGIWGANEVNKITWEITSENLYTEDSYDELMEKMLERKPITVYFGTKTQNDPDKTVADGDYDAWTGAKGYTGKVLITSLTANANNGENATYSATFTGTGKLTKVSAIPVAED